MNMPYTTAAMRRADFWIQRMPANIADTVYDRQKINAYLLQSPHLIDMAQPAPPPPPPRSWTAPWPSGYTDQGQPVFPSTFYPVQSNAVLRPAPFPYGVAVTRAALRSWPTSLAVFRQAGDFDFDQLQQTRIHHWEFVWILGESQDQEWYLVQSSIYRGWVRQEEIAGMDGTLADRVKQLLTGDSLVVGQPGVMTEPAPLARDFAPHPLDWAALIPYRTDPPKQWDHQSAQDHVMIYWPIRQKDGSLSIQQRWVNDGPGLHRSYYPTTRRHLLQQAFTLLGQRYGWGDSFDRHDCSSFIMDSYRQIGVFLPRNSRAQAEAGTPKILLSGDRAARMQQLSVQALPGDLLFMPGHIMIYLGQWQERPYVLHAFVGYREQKDSADTVWMNQVAVFPLDLWMRNVPQTYLETVTRLTRILV
ncbi:MAG: NlpC/P60 family protein [Firmicutes bacterium]|nr:NlpC/P60 family protein [Bacillota bacterium]